jgi:hypothetical protein
MDSSQDARQLIDTWKPALESHRAAVEALESTVQRALAEGFAQNHSEFALHARAAFLAWFTSSEQLRAATLNLFERAARDAGLSPSDIRGLFFIDTEDDAADAREY